MSAAPQVRGWCPGAYRPMMSGDGLIVRVRPVLGRLPRDKVLGLCELADRFGNGIIELTNRANLQLRGVSEAYHALMLDGLGALGLLDADPRLESRRNVLIAPGYAEDDLTARLTRALLDRLVEFPDLPVKFGFAVDAGMSRSLSDASADIRFEQGDGGLILRADGSATGRLVTEADAISYAVDLACWFAAHAGGDVRRMRALVAVRRLPEIWTGTAPVSQDAPLKPGQVAQGQIIGLPFGQVTAAALQEIALQTNAIRVTPWRLLILEGARGCCHPDIITERDDPLLRVDACPGAPRCPSATVDTRNTARRLAGHVAGTLHVSGCIKGCARAAPADVTLVGRDGQFDLITCGASRDSALKRGLSCNDVLTQLT